MKIALLAAAIAVGLVGCNKPTISCPVTSVSLSGASATCTVSGIGTVNLSATPTDIAGLIGTVASVAGEVGALSADRSTGASLSASDFSATVNASAKTVTWTYKPSGASVTHALP